MSQNDLSVDQERARHAWQHTAVSKDLAKEFSDLASAAPALVMANGLMQTLAYLQDKSADKHKALLRGVLSWIGPRVLSSGDRFEDVMMALFGGDGKPGADHTDTYMRATEEALEILKWIRHFAKARAKGG
jgi:CRISPR-associated protein Cmr5